jgi:hypothetical protein
MARAVGNSVSSTPSTRPIQHASGALLKSFGRSPVEDRPSVWSWAARPWPMAELAVYAVIARGIIETGIARA